MFSFSIYVKGCGKSTLGICISSAFRNGSNDVAGGCAR